MNTTVRTQPPIYHDPIPSQAGLQDEALLAQIQQLHSIHTPHTDLIHIPTLTPQASQLSV